jgi:L-ribulose-5-phosphate 3-epimerase
MKLGVIIRLNDQLEEEFARLNSMGFPTCQLNGWDANLFTESYAQRVLAASQEYRIEISGFWCGWSGPAIWNQVDGPLTLGIVPSAFRFERLKQLMQGADFTTRIGVKDMITHVGFIPENPNDPEYPGVVSALRYLGGFCQSRGVNFLFETGQETPVTLLRTIEDIGLDNIAVNLDPANLILYGKGNPVDALDVIGKYVRGVHAKDGLYPTTGRSLGQEVPLGQGKVDFPLLIQRLKELGYAGALTIEREISGEEQIRDIRMAKTYLEKIIKQG